MTGDEAAADDLVQEAFVRAFVRLAQLRRPDALSAYLRRTVINLAHKHSRRVSRERAYLEATTGRRELVVQPDLALRDQLVALGAAAATALRLAPDQRAFAAFTVVANKEAPTSGEDHHGGGEPLTHARLDQHAQCMRTHGVNVPDPQPTAGGWTIPINEPAFQDEKAWRRAFFVACRLEHVTENLVLGGRRRADIDRLMACTRAEGFGLPAPSQDGSGHFEFDLNKTSPPWGSDAWYRVVFVICAGRLPHP